MILDQIVEKRKLTLDAQPVPDLDLIRPLSYSVLDRFQAKKDAGQAIFITEFKRKSPSLGEIAYHPLEARVKDYIKQGASAVSILTEEAHFGGSLHDLQLGSAAVPDHPVLMKDFVVSSKQIDLARQYGAGMVLLIARILSQDQLKQFITQIEDLGMAALVEVHDLQDVAKIRPLKPKLVGVNSRNLDDLSLHMMRIPLVAKAIDWECIRLAESGVEHKLDVAVCRHFVDGFLIGSCLMHLDRVPPLIPYFGLDQNHLLKACGLRSNLNVQADLIGINISPESKRRIGEETLKTIEFKGKEVLVVKGNSAQEVGDVLRKYPFRFVQVYTEDLVEIQAILSKQKLIWAVQPGEAFREDWLHQVDALVLDGIEPGSGKIIPEQAILDFRWPFLLAGGMNASNLHRLKLNPLCIGVDMASGIEEDGEFSLQKVDEIKQALKG